MPFLTIFWTLAVEEQFYLVWPACIRYFREETLLVGCVASAVGIAILRNLPAIQHEDALYGNFIYRMTPLHMDGLFCGAALGILFYKNWKVELVTRTARVILPIASLAFVALSWPTRMAFWKARVTFSVLALLFGALLWLCIVPTGPTWISRLFRLTLLRRFGKYSYFIYVYHLWVSSYVRLIVRDNHFLVGSGDHPGRFSIIVSAFLSVVLIYTLAGISWRFFEGPILRLNRFVLYASSTVTGSGERYGSCVNCARNAKGSFVREV